MRLLQSIQCLLVLFAASIYAGEDRASGDWHVGGSVVYSSRSLDGSVVSKNSLSGGAFGTLVATGDSMNVGEANGMMLALAAQYKAVRHWPQLYAHHVQREWFRVGGGWYCWWGRVH